MCLHAARLPARIDAAGDLLALGDQDRTKWDRGLVAEGERLLAAFGARARSSRPITSRRRSRGCTPRAVRAEDTDWREIVALYDRLMAIRPSPVVALNRAIAVAQLEGAEAGLDAIEAIEDRDRLARYPFYPAALGELELRAGRPAPARRHFRDALKLARNPAERRFLRQRELACARERSDQLRTAPDRAPRA